jgi:hypothetical protein
VCEGNVTSWKGGSFFVRSYRSRASADHFLLWQNLKKASLEVSLSAAVISTNDVNSNFMFWQ